MLPGALKYMLLKRSVAVIICDSQDKKKKVKNEKMKSAGETGEI